MPSRSSYYDIDAILAEEELVPCSTLFDFTYLSHLDPDLSEKDHYLPESSRVKMPLWAVEKWAALGYVRLSLPRHYGRKARERLEADPTEVDLRKRNERFFMAGRMLVDMINSSSRKVSKAISAQTGRNTRRNSQLLALEQVVTEAEALRKTLLATFTGERLRQTMDWALSSVGDDVTMYTDKLSQMERRLFSSGAMSAANHFSWKTQGNRRLVQKAPKPRNTAAENAQKARAVSPENEGEQQGRNKRSRTN